MLTFKIALATVLSCVLLAAVPAAAQITVTSSSMDFLIDPDPAFDNDSGTVWFYQTTPPYLQQDASDANYWYFRGLTEYSPYWGSGGTTTTWFLKAGNEEYMEVSKLIVNNAVEAFTGYTVTLRVATLVDGSLDVDGVGYSMDLDIAYDYYGDYVTTISIVFDEPILPGQSFDLAYTLDLSGVIPPPPDYGEYGEESVPKIPEPTTLTLLLGCATVALRRRRVRHA